MTGKEKVLQTAQTKKVFRAGDVAMKPNDAHKYIERLVTDGLLERVGYGLYSLAGGDFTAAQSLLEVATKVPNGVLCLLSALRFHELTTQNPFEIWLAIERRARYPKIETVPTRIFRFAPQIYAAGIETHLIEGVEVKVYSAAKTVADCFYYQKTIGLDVAIEALRDAWHTRKATMGDLYQFSEIRHVKSVIQPYLNSLN